MVVQATGELSEKLGNFNYARERVLPSELLEAVRRDDIIIHGGRLVLQLDITLFAPPRLRDYLVDSGIANVKTRIPTLFVHDYERRIYYRQDSGERLGDELGINDWLQRLQQG